MPKSVILKRLYESLNLTISAFEAEIGMSNASIKKSIEADKDITDKIISKISKRYPEVNRKWLETGEGEMFLKLPDSDTTNDDLTPRLSTPKEVIPLGKHAHVRLKPSEYAQAFGDWPGLPMYNLPITASFVASYRDAAQAPTPYYYLHDPRFRDCDFGAVITGDSMHSEIRHGDLIACKEITDLSFVVFGDIYYIVAKNGLETCKYLNEDPKNPNNFLLVPRNEKISPSPIPKDMVLKMYKVRGIIRGY